MQCPDTQYVCHWACETAGATDATRKPADATRPTTVVRILVLSISVASYGRIWFVRPCSARQPPSDRHPRGGLGLPGRSSLGISTRRAREATAAAGHASHGAG